MISERSDSGATPPTSPSRPKPPSEAKCRVEVALSELPTPHAQLLLEALEKVLLSAQRRATQRLLLVTWTVESGGWRVEWREVEGGW